MLCFPLSVPFIKSELADVCKLQMPAGERKPGSEWFSPRLCDCPYCSLSRNPPHLLSSPLLSPHLLFQIRPGGASWSWECYGFQIRTALQLVNNCYYCCYNYYCCCCYCSKNNNNNLGRGFQVVEKSYLSNHFLRNSAYQTKFQD